MTFFPKRPADRAAITIFQEPRSQGNDSRPASSATFKGLDDSAEVREIPSETARLLPGSRLVFYTDPQSVAADRYRYLRMRLRELADTASVRSLLITSAVPRDGKSTTALNLATALAEDGKRLVLLVEADLHQPTLREQLGLAQTAGLAESLETGVDPLSLARRIEPLGFYLLAAGTARGNPTELLQSGALPVTLQKILPNFEWVIFDSPPLAPLTDALALARQTDASFLVVRAGNSPRALVEKAFELLGRKHVAGIILNQLTGVDRMYSKYYGIYGKRALLESPATQSTDSLPTDK
ncbi:MAG TPA: CpsD/CapB family tyrosine-protein kinase [Bryobacteraceae bacterium]|jgi:capsular exopolysaccharide synthesis family protein|nr:CpsD/CapB family tyrosine-protein kinase [Bryobacteraceae bacterium]